ncbi:MAG: transposase [Dehalococcoidia bacterium]
MSHHGRGQRSPFDKLRASGGNVPYTSRWIWWRRKVLNYWCCPITNAVVEGRHNRVKVLKRRAYGYRNDRHFLLRILSLIHTD